MAIFNSYVKLPEDSWLLPGTVFPKYPQFIDSLDPSTPFGFKSTDSSTHSIGIPKPESISPSASKSTPSSSGSKPS